jgi:hypothetical protein
MGSSKPNAIPQLKFYFGGGKYIYNGLDYVKSLLIDTYFFIFKNNIIPQKVSVQETPELNSFTNTINYRFLYTGKYISLRRTVSMFGL